jgi:hypothetical protein
MWRLLFSGRAISEAAFHFYSPSSCKHLRVILRRSKNGWGESKGFVSSATVGCCRSPYQMASGNLQEGPITRFPEGVATWAVLCGF